MPIREVIRMGDPRLLSRALEVQAFDTPELHSLIADLEDTMRAMQGAGIAAPQIAVGLRVVIFGGFRSARYPDAEEIPYTVLVNPELEPLSDEVEDGWEGCLSVPGMRGLVPRFRQLRYKGFDAYGRRVDRTVSDFHARVVQHECDHLDGILYPMRISNLRQFGFQDVLFPGDTAADD
jgi:peptide deformylase